MFLDIKQGLHVKMCSYIMYSFIYVYFINIQTL